MFRAEPSALETQERQAGRPAPRPSSTSVRARQAALARRFAPWPSPPVSLPSRTDHTAAQPQPPPGTPRARGASWLPAAGFSEVRGTLRRRRCLYYFLGNRTFCTPKNAARAASQQLPLSLKNEASRRTPLSLGNCLSARRTRGSVPPKKACERIAHSRSGGHSERLRCQNAGDADLAAGGVRARQRVRCRLGPHPDRPARCSRAHLSHRRRRQGRRVGPGEGWQGGLGISPRASICLLTCQQNGPSSHWLRRFRPRRLQRRRP